MKDRIKKLAEKYEGWRKTSIELGQTDRAFFMTLIRDELDNLIKDEDYELKTTWCLSTSHVSPELKDILDSEVPAVYGISVYDKETYGWYVYDNGDDIPSEAPQALHDILTMARKLGVSIIELDGSGPEINELPKYQW